MLRGAWMHGEYDLAWKKKNNQSKIFFALIPVVVWEVASETVCFINAASLTQLRTRGLNIYITELTPLRKRWICHCSSRTLQSIWAPMAKTGRDNAAASSRIYVALMIHTLSPPLRADRTRRDRVQRRHQHLQQDWKQSASLCKCQWTVNHRRPDGCIHSSGFWGFWEGDVRGFQWMTDREGECAPILLKNLESSCSVLLWINAIWLVASAIRHVSNSKGEKKGLKAHRRRCNKPNRQPADRLTYNTEEKRKRDVCPQWTARFKLHRITHTVWSDQKTEKATDLCIITCHIAPVQVNAMAWKTNLLPAFDCLKLSIYAIKAHMA